tara:strand:- start:548 stop:1390 length:843 start_codon:yes stop_codon:yes gene_type:complete
MQIKLTQLIKERLKGHTNILNTLIHLNSREYQPTSLWAKLRPEEQYSDFFVYATKFEQNIFVAENPYALLNAEPKEVVHIFRFHDSEGNQLEVFNYDSDNYFEKILLPSISSEDPYISFTHEVNTKDQSKLNILENGKVIYISQAHRGYTVYKKNSSSLGSTVHGNFGHLAQSNLNRFGAKQRNKYFKYTPIYKFESDSDYELVFNNPTRKALEVNVIRDIELTDIGENNSITIPKLGLRVIKISGYEGNMSFISKLPVCRALVFKNPSLTKSNFDVFHS